MIENTYLDCNCSGNRHLPYKPFPSHPRKMELETGKEKQRWRENTFGPKSANSSLVFFPLQSRVVERLLSQEKTKVFPSGTYCISCQYLTTTAFSFPQHPTLVVKYPLKPDCPWAKIHTLGFVARHLCPQLLHPRKKEIKCLYYFE